jgi:hypothetical protein
MNRGRTVAAWALALSVILAVAPAGAAAERAGRDCTWVQLNLRDGCVAVGEPAEASIHVTTPFGVVPLPWEKMAGGEIDEEGRATVRMRNGDRVSGLMEAERIALKTSMGELVAPRAEIASFSTRSAGAAAVEGLVLHYSFDRDEDGRVSDLSGCGNDGEVCGARWTAEGKFGGAMSFRGGPDAGDTIRVRNSESLNSPCRKKALTIAAWIRPRSLPREFPSLVCKGGNQPPAASGGYELTLNSNGDNDLCFVSRGWEFWSNGANGRWVNQRLGRWIHIAVILDIRTSMWRFYADGMDTADVHLQTSQPVLDAVDNDLIIAGPDPAHHPNRAWFDGDIDEVTIFDRALNEDEIKALVEGPPSMPPPSAPGSAPETVRATVELKDGSRLTGTIETPHLDIQTRSLGRLRIPMAAIRTLEPGEGKGAFRIALRIGGRLAGSVSGDRLDLDSSIGRVAVPLDVLKRLTAEGAP